MNQKQVNDAPSHFMSGADAPDDRPPHDQGSSLIMVLAFIVISSLIIIPMLTFATTVLRSNSVTTQKREDLEAVRGGARVAVADPVALFNTCTTSVAANLPTPPLPHVTSTCRQVGRVGVRDELEIPIGASTLQLGEQALPGALESSAAPSPSDAVDWWYGRAKPEPEINTIWMPNIPKRETSVQEVTGHPMPSPYNCRVYFPGTYAAPLVISGPTYFTSGVYYFEDTVTVVAGGRMVAGFGLAEGCLDPLDPDVPPVGDLQAVLDMDSSVQPARFNIDGLGATFVFGKKGRLVVDDTRLADGSPNNSNLPVSVVFNQRYVQDATDGGARVSIMSVNGDTDVVDPVANPIVESVGDLVVADVISVPESRVISEDNSLVRASDKGLVPSIHTPEPRPPKAPTILSAAPLGEPTKHGKEGASWVKWAAPVGNDEGGSTIVKYEVFDQNGTKRCETAGAVECIAMDLPQINSNKTTTFTVTATNTYGTSDPSAPFSVKIKNNADRITAPARPTNVAVESAGSYAGVPANAASITWDAPTFTGYAPIVSYNVKAYRVHTGKSGDVREDTGQTCTTTFFRDTPAPRTCIIEGLAGLDTTPGMGPEIEPAKPAKPPKPATAAVNSDWLGYEFEVTATNSVRENDTPANSPLLVSPPSAPSNRTPKFEGTGTATPAAAPVAPVAPTYVPDPLVDVNLSGSGSSTVNVTGYLAAPMGRVRVVNPNPAANKVGLVGGVVAGSYDVANAGLDKTKVGFEDSVLQRTIEITTRLSGSTRRSVMTIQINANAADAAVNSWVTQ